MNSSHLISDELLSAYLDRQVSEVELRRVERALAEDPTLQERLESLRSVVHLLQNTPAVVVPRPMTLSEGQVLAAGAFVRGVQQPGFWQRWIPRLTPLATAIVGVFFVLSLTMPQQAMRAIPPVAPAMQASPATFRAEAEVAPMGTEPQALTAQMDEAPMPRGRSIPETTAASPSGRQLPKGPSEKSAAGKETKATEEAYVTATETRQASIPASSPIWPRSLVSWGLGTLLVLLCYLTWRVTISPRRRG